MFTTHGCNTRLARRRMATRCPCNGSSRRTSPPACQPACSRTQVVPRVAFVQVSIKAHQLWPAVMHVAQSRCRPGHAGPCNEGQHHQTERRQLNLPPSGRSCGPRDHRGRRGACRSCPPASAGAVTFTACVHGWGAVHKNSLPIRRMSHSVAHRHRAACCTA